MSAAPRKLTPQEEARLEQARKNFQQRREITNRLKRIKFKLGVYSGKGGVGKTTVAVNLAVTLAQQQKAVALFDCDIDCPNVARLMYLTRGPTQTAERVFIPPSNYGVKVMSMAFFQKDENEAIIWRGPMIHNAINQFTTLTEWGDLDYLIVDLPPGTSDAPLTVMQTLNLDGFIVVTTPQELAVLDARRSANMIKKLNLKVLGIVENMSGDIFGRGAGEELADSMGLPFWGQVEMRREFRLATEPACLTSPKIAADFDKIAANLLRERL